MAETAIFDHYEVLRRDDGSLHELGRGAMGITYKAFDTNLRCHVALKVINAASIDSDIARQRFVREARAAAQLRHRHVASVFHLGVEGDAYFYAMEFIDGETVEALIRRNGPLDPVLSLRLAIQAARALNAAQKHQLVHRDIKPSNLMLVHEDEELILKVIDFGLAKSNRKEDCEETAALSSGGFVGTPHFASPEQLEEKEIDVRSDIYSLGVTLWYMLAGSPPFGGSLAQVMGQHLHAPPPLEQLKNVAAPLRDLLAKMLEKDPAQRPQTPLDLRKELEGCVEFLTATQPAAGATRDVELHPGAPDAREHAALQSLFHKGARVAGRYEILEDLGEGNSGWAFHAREVEMDTEVRLVVLHAEISENSEALTKIEREVEKLQGERHPNLLSVFGIERIERWSFLVAEWTDGFSMLEMLRARQEITADEALTIVQQAANGVDFAITRGIKRLDLALHQIAIHFPSSLLPAPGSPLSTWPEFAVKLNALGITREFATSDTWAGGQTIVGGIAPERESSAENLTGKYVQSLAALVYELLGGTLSPVILGGAGVQQPPRYVPLAGLSEEGNEVLKQALNPARSFASAQDFCAALKAAAGETKKLGAAVSPASKLEREGSVLTATPKSKFPLGWIIAAVAAVAIVGEIAVLFLRQPAREITPVVPSQTPTISRATPSPAPTAAATATPPKRSPQEERQALLKTKLAEAENSEAAHDWPNALATYLSLAREFPESDTGKVRLEMMLASLRPTLDKMSDDEFAKLRGPITEAAKLDVGSAMMTLGAHLRKTEPGEAFKWFAAAAARGITPALVQVGLMYSNGAGVERDFAKAANWFQQASDKGDAAGKACLGECYLYGRGVKKDERRAVEILQDAVAGGDPRAMNLLGTCYHQGIGTPKNFDEAFRLFSQAQELKFGDAAGNLGVLYINGDGVPQDAHKAVELFQQGARDGNAYCMYLLARCLELGTGLDANQLQAESWYKKSAEAGNPRAAEWCRKNNVAFTPK